MQRATLFGRYLPCISVSHDDIYHVSLYPMKIFTMYLCVSCRYLPCISVSYDDIYHVYLCLMKIFTKYLCILWRYLSCISVSHEDIYHVSLCFLRLCKPIINLKQTKMNHILCKHTTHPLIPFSNIFYIWYTYFRKEWSIVCYLKFSGKYNQEQEFWRIGMDDILSH
jgi:hypothetical protein